jgi:hypothetical protein
MQLRGWELTRASRIVLILLVVQHLGLSQLLVVASAPGEASDSTPPAWSIGPTDAVLSPSVVIDPHIGTRTTHGAADGQTIPPDPAPPSRRLPRAPPAA